ncbi:MAG: thiamine pyrophosphate-dependent enzyme [Candidatus Latescibacterota bacterium]
MRLREARPHLAWLAEAGERNRGFRARFRETPAPVAPPMTGRHIVDALRPFVEDEALFLVDGGNIGQWAHMALCDRYPGHWLTCGASGVVGWGLPGAMAAKCAFPDRPVILLSGDGSIGFTLTELESSVRQGMSFVVVVADDRAWGIVANGQEEQYGSDGVLASRLGEIRYALVAEGLGAIGVRVESPDQIGPAIQRGLAADRPTLIHVPIDGMSPIERKNQPETAL